MLRLPAFTYHRPSTAVEAVRIAMEHGPEAMFVAGGTDLYPNMKRRVQRPTQVVSLGGIDDLMRIEGDGSSGISIGAMTTLTKLEEAGVVAEAYPGFHAAVASISTPLLRNMGTIGGNLLLDTRCNYYDQTEEWREGVNFCMKCDGDICWVAPSSPRCWAVQSSDTVPVLMAIGAEVSLLSAEGERRIPLVDLYRDDGIQFTNKQPGELLTHLHLPAQDGWRSSYKKLRRRGSFDFPVLGVGVFLRMDGDRIAELRIRIGGIGSIAQAASATEEMLIGQKPEQELIRAAARESFKPNRAMDNTDHEAGWRKKMVPIFVARAIEEAMRIESREG